MNAGSWGVFPGLVIFYILKNQASKQALLWTLLAAIPFDLFSGLEFGRVGLAVVGMSLTASLAFRFFSINHRSVASILFFSIFFLLEYLAILDLGQSGVVLLTVLPVYLSSGLLTIWLVNYYQTPGRARYAL